MRVVVCLWSMVLATVLGGCGSGDKLKTHHVTGKVTLQDGKPMAGGLVIFHSVEHKISASGAIGEDGTCQMSTYQPEDGAVAGQHRVAIVAPRLPLDPRNPVPPPTIAPKYNDPATSELEFTVTPAGPNQFDFQVTSQ